MKFQGNLSIARPVEKVWEFLWDIEKLTSCIPGCESVKTIKDREKYELTVKDSVGPITVHFELLAEVKKLEPLKRIEIALEGKDFKAGGVRQTMHARKKFEEQLHKLERQKIDIEESLSGLRRAIASIDEAMAKGVLTAQPQRQRVAAE